ncbi:MAG: hypothetical protein KatS3mg054_0065 [Chloroflexus sp.]|nr:MAG: hypothetical protein KatS3mg054_0065 [Chloroflexus sp.]
MISVPVSLVLSSPSGYSGDVLVTFLSASPQCVTFSQSVAAAVKDGNLFRIDNVVHYSDVSCIGSDVTAVVRYGDGCTLTVPIVISSPCTWDVTLAYMGYLTFLNQITGPIEGMEVEWDYDKLLYEAVVEDNNNLILKYRLGKPVTSAQKWVSVTVRDKYGCEVTKQVSYSVCMPSASGITLKIPCLAQGISGGCGLTNVTHALVKYNMRPFVGSECGDIDWSTLNIPQHPGFCFINHGNGYVSIYRDKTGPEVFTVNAQVNTVNGEPSEVFVIYLEFLSCTSGENFVIVPDQMALTAAHNIGSKLVTPLEGRVLGEQPDWNTLAVEIAPTYGVAQITANRELEYEVTSLADLGTADNVRLTIDSVSGKTAKADFLVSRSPQPLPSVPQQTICMYCGQTLQGINLLTGGTNVDVSRIEITPVTSSKLSFRHTGNGVGYLTLASNFDGPTPGVGLFGKVYNHQGVSNSFMHVIYAVCSGYGSDVRIDTRCIPGQQFTLLDRYTGYVAASVQFTEITAGSTYVSQGGTIGSNGEVNFSAITPGEYVFEVKFVNQGPCAGVQDLVRKVTVNHEPEPSIEIQTVNTIGPGNYEVIFTATGIASQFEVQDDGGVALLLCPITVIAPDTYTFKTKMSSGSIMSISATDVCGLIKADTFTMP